MQSDNEGVSDELLILASQKYEDDQGWYMEENDETDQILSLASQKSLKNSIEVMGRCLEILIYDMDHQKVQSKLVKQEGLVFLKKHKGKISGLQRCGVIGYNTD